jgi:hypothetical protein
MPKPPLNERPTASGEIQSEFDGLYGLSLKRQNLTPAEVATHLGVNEKTVRNYLDEGLLVNASVQFDAEGKEVKRDHVRIARFSVIALWREQLAAKGFEPPFFQSPEVKWWRSELAKKKTTNGHKA